jgi:hypothetical protein
VNEATKQYEAELFANVKYYTTTQFLGRAKYDVTKFDTLPEAQAHHKKQVDLNPHAKIIVYAVCQPPNRSLPVSMPVTEVGKYS